MDIPLECARTAEEGGDARRVEKSRLKPARRCAIMLSAFLALLCFLSLTVEGVLALLENVTTDSDFMVQLSLLLAAYRNCSATHGAARAAMLLGTPSSLVHA